MIQKNGSALLYVILVFAIFTIYMTQLLYTAGLAVDFVLQRTNHIKKEYTVNGMVEYATAWTLDNFEKIVDRLTVIKKLKKTIIWSPDEAKKVVKGLLSLTPQEEALALNLMVTFDRGVTSQRSWIIHKRTDGGQVRFYITQCASKQADR